MLCDVDTDDMLRVFSYFYLIFYSKLNVSPLHLQHTPNNMSFLVVLGKLRVLFNTVPVGFELAPES